MCDVDEPLVFCWIQWLSGMYQFWPAFQRIAIIQDDVVTSPCGVFLQGFRSHIPCLSMEQQINQGYARGCKPLLPGRRFARFVLMKLRHTFSSIHLAGTFGSSLTTEHHQYRETLFMSVSEAAYVANSSVGPLYFYLVSSISAKRKLEDSAAVFWDCSEAWEQGSLAVERAGMIIG